MAIAFFDFDETVITGKSMFLFLREYSNYFKLNVGLSFSEVMDEIQCFSDEGKSREYINRYYYSIFKGEEQSKVRDVASKVFQKGMYEFNCDVLNKIKDHQSNNDDVVFVSGAMKDIIYPMMNELGVSNSLCSDPIVLNGLYTGELHTLSIGYYKAVNARCYAESHGQDLSKCYAYGDHISDFDMLKLVGHPCAVNPSIDLMEEANKQGWNILCSSPIVGR